MRLERFSGLSMLTGLIVLFVALAVIGTTRLAMNTSVVHRAAPDLLAVPVVTKAVTDEMSLSIAAAYRPRVISAESAEAAARRMVENGYFVDEFQRTLGDAHREWRRGAVPVLVFDDQVVTAAAIAGLRDVDLDLALEFPDGGLVTAAPVDVPFGPTVSDMGTIAWLAALSGLLGMAVVGISAWAERDLSRAVERVARVAFGAGALVLVAAFVLPTHTVRVLNNPLGMLGGAIGAVTLVMAVTGVVLMVSAVALRAVMAELAPVLVRRARRRAGRQMTAPSRSGTFRRRPSASHRQQALDAFFSADDDRSRSDAPRPEGASRDDIETGEPPAPFGDGAAPTPQEARSAAAAADRRDALERIDGTKARLRTYRKR